MTRKSKRKKGSKTSQKATINFWSQPRFRYALGLIILSFVVFGNSIQNGYTYDDKPFIEKNYLVQQGVKGIPQLLVTDFWAGYTNVHEVNPSYRPVPLISLAIEHQFWGLNPTVNHFFNVLFYGLTCVVLFFLLHTFFKKEKIFLALGITVLFCLHPIHTEVVANVKGRDDLLALLFGVSTIYLLFKYIQAMQLKWLVAALICYVLALLSKSYIITWVAIIPLCLYFFSQLSLKKIITSTIPFLLVSVVYFVVRTVLLGTAAIKRTDFIDNPILNAEGTAEALATKIAVLGLYLQKLLFPHPLSSDYSYQAIEPSTWGDPMVYLSLVLYLSIIALIIQGFKKRSVVAFGFAFFLITISPISNLLFDYVVAFAERSLYTPSLGFIIAIGMLFYSAMEWLTKRKPQLRNAALGLGGVALALMAFKSISRNPVWKDDLTLFSADIKTMPESIRLNLLYAQELIDRNTRTNPVPMNADLNEAKRCLDRVLLMVPDLGKAHLAQGNLAKVTGQYPAALQAYKKAEAIDPNNPAIYFNLGLIAQIRNDLVEAERLYLKSLELFPNYASVLSNLGIIYGRKNDLDQCITYLEKAIAINPNLVSALSNLENAYNLKGDKVKAAYYRTLRSQIGQ